MDYASADFEARLLAALTTIDQARPAATASLAEERRTGTRSRPTVPGLRRTLPIPVVAVGVLALTGTGVAASQLLDKSRVDFVPATSSLTAGTSLAVKGIGCARGAEGVFSRPE